MLPRFALLALLLAMVYPSFHGQIAARADRYRAAPPGLALSVALPWRAYPRNALVRVTIRAKNISKRAIPMFASACPLGSLYAVALTAAGRVVYPPAISGGPPLSCPAPVPPSPGAPGLLPGKTVTTRVLVILRGPYLRPIIMLPTFCDASCLRTATFEGRMVFVHLTTGAPPRLALRPSEATVPVNGHRGPLYYDETGWCGTPGGLPQSGWISGWQTTQVRANGHYRIDPGCQPVLEWHLVAGWLNEPVAAANYHAPGDAATPPPPPPITPGTAQPLSTPCRALLAAGVFRAPASTPPPPPTPGPWSTLCP